MLSAVRRSRLLSAGGRTNYSVCGYAKGVRLSVRIDIQYVGRRTCCATRRVCQGCARAQPPGLVRHLFISQLLFSGIYLTVVDNVTGSDRLSAFPPALFRRSKRSKEISCISKCNGRRESCDVFGRLFRVCVLISDMHS